MVFNIAGDAPYKVQQGIANDRPEIAQRIIEKAEKSIGAIGFEPATSAPKAPVNTRLFREQLISNILTEIILAIVRIEALFEEILRESYFSLIEQTHNFLNHLCRIKKNMKIWNF